MVVPIPTRNEMPVFCFAQDVIRKEAMLKMI